MPSFGNAKGFQARRRIDMRARWRSEEAMMQALTTRHLLPRKEDVRSELSKEREDAVVCRLVKREQAAESPVHCAV
jgi:hypothetical protein